MDDFCGLVFKSAVMQDLWRKIETVAKTDLPVLICGETGTGKELVAKAIHYLSRKHRGQFIPVNCGGIPESLIEKELFGSNRGAFTGAGDSQVGAFETANNGSIFLDEISEASMQFQVNLLRVLETKEIKRVGAANFQKIDTRVIIATNKNLDELVEKKKFRNDLLYRLKILPLDVPPLRKREEDALLLVEYFFTNANVFTGLSNDYNTLSFPLELREMILDYCWPGNVRELKNMVLDAIVFTDRKPHKFEEIMKSALLKLFQLDDLLLGRRELDQWVGKPWENVQVYLFQKTLDACSGNITKAAQQLGVNRYTLYRILWKASRLQCHALEKNETYFQQDERSDNGAMMLENNGLCKNCNKKPIKYKKSRLCNRCYMRAWEDKQRRIYIQQKK